MDWGNQARAEMRRPGGLRVAWASLVAALYLALPIGGTAQGPRPAAPLDAIPAILDAFRSHRVVSFPGGHTDGNEVQALLRALVKDPRFAATVNDIVVEFGSSRYQDVMDRYIRGDDVPESTVRRAWLDAVQPGISLDNQNTPAFFRAVREANAKRPVAEKTRVRSVTRRSIGRTSATRPTTASGKSSATPIRPTWSGGSCSRTTGAR